MRALCLICAAFFPLASHASYKIISNDQSFYWSVGSAEYHHTTGETVRGVAFRTVYSDGKDRNVPVMFPDRMLFDVVKSQREELFLGRIKNADGDISAAT